MNENYIDYWGLKQHPFLLAPDSNMMHMAGQYYECFERLKYAVNTNKGGALVVSEDAGLGKTTILIKLINEMKELYGNTFKYAFVEHPTLTSDQLIAYITGCFSDSTPDEDSRPGNLTIDFIHNRMQIISDLSHSQDKLKNLMILKEALIDVKKQGGKSIIIIDEGQMLCGAREILQELRALINLTYNNEYLHTFIFSGQRPLWNEVKSIPEFWQRLPVRYYFIPLQHKETKDLINHRLMMAGLDSEREIFTGDAIYIIQKYSMGSPRTIIALADLSLLIGCNDHSSQIGFKEISKVINTMSGKGESLAYIKEEKTKKEPAPDNSVRLDARREATVRKTLQVPIKTEEDLKHEAKKDHVRPLFAVLAIVFSIITGLAAGYHLTSGGKNADSTLPVKKETIIKDYNKPLQEVQENTLHKAEPVKSEEPAHVESPGKQEKEALIIVSGANIRSSPDINAARIGLIFNNEIVRIIDEKTDANGKKWYKFRLYNARDGWISEDVISVR